MKAVVQFAWLLLVGVGLLGGAAYLTVERLAFIEGAQRAQGKVVEMVRRNGARYAPRVRFATADGSEQIFTSTARSNLPSLSAGEPVTVLYDKECPANAVIDSFGELWGGILILGIIGTAFLLAGAGLFVSRFLATRASA